MRVTNLIQRWEPALYRLYYRLPLLSYRQKRLLVLALHRYLGFLTRHTESYRHFDRTLTRVGIDGRPTPLRYHDGSRNYQAWLRRYGHTRDLAARTRALPRQPLISLVVPPNDFDPNWLTVVVSVLKRQPYEHWELIITRNRPAEAVLPNDDRIRWLPLSQNDAKQDLATIAAGEYIALLEPGTLPEPSALYHFAHAFLNCRETALLFSDEDRIDTKGHRDQPYFKPAWDPELALQHDLIGGLAIYRRGLLESVDAQLPVGGNHALFLELSEHLPDHRIGHLPIVLHHRIGPTTSMAPIETVQAALQRRGISATVKPSPLQADSVWRQHRLPHPPPRVSLIIPTRNGLALLRQCIDSLLSKTDYPNYELIVVDNGSDDPATLDYLAQLADTVRCLRLLRDPGPFNYSRLNNSAVKHAEGAFIGLLNNDLEIIDSGWLTEMVGLALQPEVGAVGARLLYPDGRIQHAGVMVGFGDVAGHVPRGQSPDEPFLRGWTQRVRSMSAVTAACLVMRRALYLELGGLDEINLPVAFNDVDLCLRVRAAGYRVVYTPFATLYHHESATRGPEWESSEKVARAAREIDYMRARWKTDTFEDCAYGPNVSRYHEAGAYAFPPLYRRGINQH